MDAQNEGGRKAEKERMGKKEKYKLKVVHNQSSKVHESGTKKKFKREGNCSDDAAV